MKRRKLLLYGVLTLFVLLAVGWSVGNMKLYSYDNTNLLEEAKELPFQAKLPTKVPFDEMEVSNSTVTPDKEEMTVVISNIPNKEHLEIAISKESPSLKGEIEMVEIGQGIQGKFISDYSGKRSLSWQENNVNYQIFYYYKLTPKEVSKSKFIKMAESFE
ncbi:hypothetical protein [Sutcliffiella deserti]|uniref:hypothetical protein n=1 Tax=Sutcliffiella deserti TaxID=2875501 RepID=UPI001CC1A77B|nr:hypothetical protein [Sutcliffiella deserti]